MMDTPGSFPLSSFGFMRVAVVVPELRVADVEYNSRTIIEALGHAASRGAQFAVFPELCITGYSCADLFYQALLLQHAREALALIADASARYKVAAGVGLPIQKSGKLYNCAAFVANGKVVGIVPKTFLPNTNEFYEERWFTSASEFDGGDIEIDGNRVQMGPHLVFRASNVPDCIIGIEICEDLWAVNPPSGNMAVAGANVLANLSASNELLGKQQYRRELVKQQSARCLAAYLYTSAGPNESTTDVVYSGHALIAENGTVLTETERFQFSTQIAIADIDLQRLSHERIRNSAFSASKAHKNYTVVDFELPEATELTTVCRLLNRPMSRTPFVPSDAAQRVAHCKEIFAIQATALTKRLKHTRAASVCLGLSGGLDSTLALLVTIRAFEILCLERRRIIAVTMPGFGTSSRTRTNAERLAELLGISLRKIAIGEAVRQHFKDIGQDETVHDVTFENAQARERTQILMDVANQTGGLVIGTGDLSELALGWCTYNGDQMSMYHVNAGVPKTLVRYLIEWCAESESSADVSDVLNDICNTPITPELLPLGENETLQQETESTIGPYELHDFFLFYAARYTCSPRKVFFLARQAFEAEYSAQKILHTMRVFYSRFFSQQFKRSAMPDGPKVGSVALSPRGDWRMPSDASSALWLQDIDALADLLPSELEAVRTSS